MNYPFFIFKHFRVFSKPVHSKRAHLLQEWTGLFFFKLRRGEQMKKEIKETRKDTYEYDDEPGWFSMIVLMFVLLAFVWLLVQIFTM